MLANSTNSLTSRFPRPLWLLLSHSLPLVFFGRKTTRSTCPFALPIVLFSPIFCDIPELETGDDLQALLAASYTVNGRFPTDEPDQAMGMQQSSILTANVASTLRLDTSDIESPDPDINYRFKAHPSARLLTVETIEAGFESVKIQHSYTRQDLQRAFEICVDVAPGDLLDAEDAFGVFFDPDNEARPVVIFAYKAGAVISNYRVLEADDPAIESTDIEELTPDHG